MKRPPKARRPTPVSRVNRQQRPAVRPDVAQSQPEPPVSLAEHRSGQAMQAIQSAQAAVAADQAVAQGVPTWRDVTTWTDEAVAEQICADRIDVLVDLGGHSDSGRLLASPLADGQRYMRALEAVYRDLWRLWCNLTPPAGARHAGARHAGAMNCAPTALTPVGAQ